MEVLAMILAGGRGSRLDILSAHRVKPGVPFAGKFRIIDFTLSNCSNSGIYNVALLTQYLPLSLNEHIGSGRPWDFDRRDSSITLLQPYETSEDKSWYKGTADAIRQNIRYIKNSNAKYVLILSGDHIYKMNYQWMLDEHKKNNAALTIAAKTVPYEEANRFGIFEVDDTKKILSFEEKPENPKSNFASMGIYIFNTDTLIKYIENEEIPDLDFGKHVIPKMLTDNERIFLHCYDSYWKDVGTYDSYLEANIDLIKKSEEVGINLYDENWKIYTRSKNAAPVRIGVTGSILNSLVCDGCKIEGRVENSVIGPNVTVRAGSTVRNSIIFEDTYIDENSHLEKVIVDKKVYVGKYSLIGHGDDYKANNEKPDLLSSGISVLGKKVHVGENVTIGRNVRIFPEKDIDSHAQIGSGETLK
ncbi:glucose-1-phosphate adenylyltransferase [Oceanivirga miroungae]|uniref:Glucose-1-phosphate adenylyltransferase n=1 Tax=Oceanivirga miroungae TaxID=1130046 RepID=A0A6I8M7W7_9FUSO|nr:glucose-1-phosphate adenylyltransferase [Oceanivirga miroungae]VWL85590.1 D-glycero-D-manno-heptose 1-phosphate guanosyltransferase [Oceanivirga miroungae]